MRFPCPAILCSLLLLCATQAGARDLEVVASIRPVHSLVAAVMGKAPDLLVDGVASPHHFSLKPSGAGMLQQANIVFWIGPAMENFLEGAIATIAAGADSVALIEAPGVTTHAYRAGAADEAEDDDHDHDSETPDGHVWLDPLNAAAMAERIASELASVDPENAASYRANAAELAERLRALDSEIAAMLRPLRGRPYIVFHDAYQYFERRYGLEPAQVIALRPEVMPGADRIRALRRRIGEAAIGCVFAEPQFDAKLVAVIAEGMAVRTAMLDPLGAAIEAGPDHYFELLRAMAAAFRDCLED